jgi:hypothetical protein
MTTVRRLDRLTLDAKKAQKLDNGFLRAPAQISRTGVYEYLNEDGSVRREFRDAAEVFHEDSLRSFAMMPITDGHPAAGWVTADNAREYQRGQMGETLAPAPDGKHVLGTMMVTDAALVKKILDGSAVEVSCGYTCQVDETPGEYQGQRYDCRQHTIRGNHVAVLPRGRAGADARIKLDAAGHAVITDSRDSGRQDPPGGTVKITIRGITFDVADQVAEALNAERSDSKQALDTLAARVVDAEDGATAAQTEVEKQTARADTAEAEVKKQTARADGAASPDAIAKIVAERTDLMDVAHRAGVEVKADSFDAGAIKRAVVEKLAGLKLDGKSPDYVQAAFDIERAKLDAKVTGTEIVAAVDGNGQRTDASDKSARQDMIDEQNARWKKPIPGAVTAKA